MTKTKSNLLLSELASAWSELMLSVDISENDDGERMQDVHRANEAVLHGIQEYIIETKDMRLMSLLQLLGYANYFMEQKLWPEYAASIEKEVQEALDDPRPSIPHEQAMKFVREKVQASRDGLKNGANTLIEPEAWDVIRAAKERGGAKWNDA